MEKKESEEKLRDKTKILSIKEGVSWSVMQGAGPSYITPYALSIGANNAQIGFLTSIPILLGNMSQLFTSKLLEKTSRKKVIVRGVLLQALMWLPILAIGYLFFYTDLDHGISATLMIVFYTLFIVFGSFVNPAWNSLMKDTVLKARGDFFGRRNKILGAVTLASMLICGLILNYFKKTNLIFIGFVIIFGIAFIARLLSDYFLSKHYEPKLKLKKKYYFSLGSFIRNVPKSNFGKFSVFIALITFGSAIASPFFAVYILRDLNFDYIIWTLIIVTHALSSLISMPLWGKFADRFGNLRVLRWTGAFVFLVPLLWFLTTFIIKINVPLVIGYLILIELFSGFIWAGFNLSAINFIYDATSREKLPLCVSYYNVFNGIGVFLGATLGGFISSLNINLFGVITPILFVFLISGVARFGAYILMVSKIKEVRKVDKYHDGEFEKEMKEMLLPSPFKFMTHHNNNHILHMPKKDF